jgi:hypothetical protein
LPSDVTLADIFMAGSLIDEFVDLLKDIKSLIFLEILSNQFIFAAINNC